MVKQEKPKLFFGMDGVLADIQSGITGLKWEEQRKLRKRFKYNWSIFMHMKPTKGAKRAIMELSKYYEPYVVSTAPWNEAWIWAERLDWIQEHFGGKGLENPFHKKVIFTEHKDLVYSPGSCLIDDKYIPQNGAGDFLGQKIWLRLVNNDTAKCAEEYADKVEECHSWYDVLHLLLTIKQNDDAWTKFKDELTDASKYEYPK